MNSRLKDSTYFNIHSKKIIILLPTLSPFCHHSVSLLNTGGHPACAVACFPLIERLLVWPFFITILVGQPHTVFGGIPVLTSAAVLGARSGLCQAHNHCHSSPHYQTGTHGHQSYGGVHLSTCHQYKRCWAPEVDCQAHNHCRSSPQHQTGAHEHQSEHQTSQHAINTSWVEQSDTRVTVQINEHVCSVRHLPTCLSQHNDHLAHSLL